MFFLLRLFPLGRAKFAVCLTYFLLYHYLSEYERAGFLLFPHFCVLFKNCMLLRQASKPGQVKQGNLEERKRFSPLVPADRDVGVCVCWHCKKPYLLLACVRWPRIPPPAAASWVSDISALWHDLGIKNSSAYIINSCEEIEKYRHVCKGNKQLNFFSLHGILLSLVGVHNHSSMIFVETYN